jgi:hypothetical protein
MAGWRSRRFWLRAIPVIAGAPLLILHTLLVFLEVERSTRLMLGPVVFVLEIVIFLPIMIILERKERRQHPELRERASATEGAPREVR